MRTALLCREDRSSRRAAIRHCPTSNANASHDSRFTPIGASDVFRTPSAPATVQIAGRP